MLFLEMEITSLPQMEKPETPSLCPLTSKGCGVQLLFYQKDNKSVVITCRCRGKTKTKLTRKGKTTMIVSLTSSSPRYVKFCQESWKQVNGSQVPLTARKKNVCR